MLISELVKPTEDAELWHPEIGRVSWSDPDRVYVRYLNHSIGREKGQRLYADWHVLTGTDWELYTGQDVEQKKLYTED